MLILGIESSCDETGVALYDTARQTLAAHALHSQMAMHAEYGGVVPELAGRDHIRRLVPLTRECLQQAAATYSDIGGIGYTRGPGLGGALLTATAYAHALAFALDIPLVGVHHLEGHLLSPFLSEKNIRFPFTALLVSGGHSQFIAVHGIGQYRLLGESVDDAAGEAFDKTAKLLGLPYPGGALLAKLAENGNAAAFDFPRPMLHSGDLNMSFSGLKTAALTEIRKLEALHHGTLPEQTRADLCAAFQAAVVEVLFAKARQALQQTGMKRLVVAGGVGANRALRARLRTLDAEVFFPDLQWCTDNGAMIAYAAAQHIDAMRPAGSFDVRPRWPLSELFQTA